jgi:shikimate dehydrogenase
MEHMNNAISGTTRVCGLIGDPVEHTISPALQNAAFTKMGLDYVYVPLRVNRADLRLAVDGIRALQIRGMNVTLPHKIAIIPLLDEVDTLARRIGAVNTIVNQNGVLKGYNTDAAGFLQALQAANISVANKNILIMGSGGAARAIAFVLADRGARITLINRTAGPASELAEWIFTLFRHQVKAVEMNAENLATEISANEIIINTTSVGMSPLSGDCLVKEHQLTRDMTVIDIVYNPVRTRLLEQADLCGARTMSGLEMLVRQGAAAFELWTGATAPLEEMRQAAAEAMERNEN